MTKKRLIAKVSARTNLSQQKVRRGLMALLDVLKQQFVSGEPVRVRGFGTFSTRYITIKKRVAGNEGITSEHNSFRTEQRRMVRFRPGQLLIWPGDTSKVALSMNHQHSGGIMSDKPENEAHEQGQDKSDGACYGLDVGTSRIVLASGNLNHIKTNTQLNAFVTVPYSKFTENILRQNKITYQMNGAKELLIFGNESEKFANSFNVECRRPMYNGLLNPNEVNSWPVIQSIIELLVRKTKKNEMLCFSVPGAPRGGEANLVYHEGMIKKFLEDLGYKAKSVNEGLSVVFAELEKDNFTGIGISCGGGMCNVCFAFMSVPVFSFSVSKAGDYIDNSVASVTSEVPTRIRVIKEESLDLSRNPKDKYESAMHIYYEEMILTLVEGLRTEISESRNLPKLDRAIPIVLSGGTAKPKGFLQKFEKVFRQNDFPIKISEVRVAEEPLTATARGCYIAAAYEG